jgi:hypothetical protein
MQHSEGDPFVGHALDGDDNACVDFRYSPSSAMTWWFDHHRTAFQPRTLRQHFDEHPDERKVFDPEAPSCTGMMVRVLTARFGFRVPDYLESLVRWADVIDAAQFPNAKEAVSLDTPPMSLAAWVASCREPAAIARYIDAISRRDLAEVAAEAWLAPALASLADDRKYAIDLVKTRAQRMGEVVSYDLTADRVVGASGFIGYYLFPDAQHTVGLSLTGDAVKISVGRNPWLAPSPSAPLLDIGALCERHGGGGHAAVGGVTLPVADLERARTIAREIRDALLAA